ncbi:MAG: OmpA family protein [Polyangiaceae bacterium]|nr:OmpA family protein [Polyangiaceae bacterium]
MRAPIIAVGSLIALFGICGCKKKGTDEPAATPTGETAAPTVTAEPATAEDDPDDDPKRGNISISDEIRKACGISDAEAFFAYDSANVRPQDRAVLRKLADCFVTGPLKGRQMRLVGHADPRGSDEYNMVLGSRRAENVRTSIIAEGLPSDRAETTSRGEMEAQGTDEASWARDRRVDIVLAD